jgi:hypothetical protein
MAINWLASTFILNNNGLFTSTSYQDSGLKKQKYKFLLEMLPTIEILKIRHPSLYHSSLLCFHCSVIEEDFNHIWLCSSSSNQKCALINSTCQLLFFQLVDLKEVDSIPNDLLRRISLSSIWNLIPQGFNFCFIDIIKGLVPLDLYDCIFEFLNNKQITFSSCQWFIITFLNKLHPYRMTAMLLCRIWKYK